jgi:protein O-GlcNAc transferase
VNSEVQAMWPERARQAAVAFNAGQWNEAEQLVSEILLAIPDDFAALTMAGILAARARRTQDAATFFARALSVNPDDVAAQINYGNVLIELHRFEEAISCCDAALAIDPSLSWALFNRGLALTGLSRTEEALESFSAASGAAPDFAEAHYHRGLALSALKRPADAVESYARAIQIKPDCAGAYLSYGRALQTLNRLDSALANYEHAVRLRPDSVEAHEHRAFILLRLQRLDEAEKCYRQVLGLKPDHLQALCNRGYALLKLRRFPEALECYDRALRINADLAHVHQNRGLVLQELDRSEDALQSYARALAIAPAYAEAHFNRGVVLQQLKRYEQALAEYDLAIRIKPVYSEAHHNRGATLRELGRLEAALASYASALQVSPGVAETHLSRGTVLQQLGRYESALIEYQQAVALKPNDADAHLNSGAMLQELKRFDEASKSYHQALLIRPDCAEVFNNRGVAALEGRRFKEAIENCDRALQIRPDYPWLYGTALHAKMHLCEWDGIDARLSELMGKIARGERACPPFGMLGLTDSGSAQRRMAEAWTLEKYPELPAPPFARRLRRERICIGYYSADFHSHATAYLLAEVLEKHDRSRFELIGFSYGPDERDAMRRRMAAAFDRFLDVRTNTYEEIAQLSRQLGVDIAVDLKGFTEGGRAGIFARRAAPIQVSYLGYPGTTGAGYMDYLIADHVVIPPQYRAHYSEKIAYLPGSYQANDRQREIAGMRPSRSELGLPEAGFVFCCFNNNYKITPDIFDSWMRMLRKVERSVLWLLQDNDEAANNLRSQAQTRNVDPRRLIFARRLPLAEHLARHHAADLFLDTFPCNAHTTASDALWAGLPVLTRTGEAFASRVAGSLLHAVGLSELITASADQYEALAIELARGETRLAAYRQRLLRNRLEAPLFDSGQLARHIEGAYMQMYERYLAGLSPDNIFVTN